MNTAQPDARGFVRGALCLELSALLYEQVVYLPNFLAGDPLRARAHFGALHSVSSPGFFHGPVALGLALGMAALWFSPCRNENRRGLRRLTTVVLLAGGLSLLPLLKLNAPLFFETIPGSAADLSRLAWVWSGVNLTRLGLLALAMRWVGRLKSSGSPGRDSE